MLKREGESRHPRRAQTVVVSYVAVEEDGRSGLVIEVFDDSDKTGADVILHGCPQSCMQNPVEDLHEVCEDMVEVLLVLEIIFGMTSVEKALKARTRWYRGPFRRFINTRF